VLIGHAGAARNVKGLRSLGGDKTLLSKLSCRYWYWFCTPAARFASSDMPLSVQLAMYIWQEAAVALPQVLGGLAAQTQSPLPFSPRAPMARSSRTLAHSPKQSKARPTWM
jgi:hypothetical protein